MKDNLLAILLFILFIAALIGLLEFMHYYAEGKLDVKCKQRFGQDWQGRFMTRFPDYCINSNGDIKYL